MNRSRVSHSLYGFQPQNLPTPKLFFAGRGITLKGHGLWRSALCVFHADSKPSLRIHIESGAFRCMACGAKGRDVLAFLQLADGLSFKEAAKALGAYDEDPALGGVR